MEQKSDLQHVEPLRRTLKQLNKNNECVYPDCTQKPCKSHVIAESVLKRLTDSHRVLTLEPSEDDVIVNSARKRSWDQVFREPKSIGIGDQATYRIFCSEHDNRVFEPLEKPGFSYEPQQVSLLAYRALCYKTWNKNTEKKLEIFLSDRSTEVVQQNRRILSQNTMVEAREKLENILKLEDYRSLKWIKRVLSIQPCVACTDAVICYTGVQDIINIANGNVVFSPEDVMTITFYPDKKPNTSICIVTWFEGSERSTQFIRMLDLGNPLEGVVINNIMYAALSMRLIYMSSAWWDTLTDEQKNAIYDLQVRRRNLGVFS